VKKLGLWLLAFVAILGVTTIATARATTFVELDPGSTLAQQAIKVASPEIERRGADVADFETAVYLVDSSLVVLFQRRGRPGGQRGSSDEYPSFEVYLDSDGTHVLRAHSSR
jgi:hypothetical protein